MIYIGTARTVVGLVTLLQQISANGAAIDISGIEHYSGVEVWYDEYTNTVFLQ